MGTLFASVSRPRLFVAAETVMLAPILLRLARHGRRSRVLDLNPMRRPARPIERAKALRHNTFISQFAGVIEEDVAVPFEDLVQDNSG